MLQSQTPQHDAPAADLQANSLIDELLLEKTRLEREGERECESFIERNDVLLRIFDGTALEILRYAFVTAWSEKGMKQL